MLYEIQNQKLHIEYDPAAFRLIVTQGNRQWRWKHIPSIYLENGKIISFSNAECTSRACKTGVTEGVSASYRNFTDGENVYPYQVESYVGLDISTGNLRVEVSLQNDGPGEIHALQYPPAFGFDAAKDEGYTILPRMQGTLLPAGHSLTVDEGIIYERDAYLPIYGQVWKGNGYLAIFDTPYDARYHLEQGEISPMFVTSLGYLSYRRVMLYAFREHCDFSSLAGVYRNYLAEKGRLVTLKEKIARNPNVAKMIGTPVIHTDIATHISPDSHFYQPDHPEHNDTFVSFEKRAEQLRTMKEKGVEKAYLHLDGWGKHGYDNLHPDVFPPHEAAGGAEGMKILQETCTELGYLFAVHDQYRDYYYDAETFSLDNAVTNLDGSHPFCSFWNGGKHSFLCAALAPEYVRRNYNTFDRLNIHLDGSYLDVFSVVGLDECFHPKHRMTREQCAQYRRECLDILTARGIIPSSEEVLGCVVDSQVLCHHAPFYTTNMGDNDGDEIGTSIPLLTLVYHDCVIVPWIGIRKTGGWGIPQKESPFLWALLCGDPVYYDIEETTENIKLGKIALDLHQKVAFCSLSNHEFIDGNIRHRRSQFSDGTVVEADLDLKTFIIRYPDGQVVSGDCN